VTLPIDLGPAGWPEMAGAVDTPLDDVMQELLRLDPEGLRWSTVIRRTFDMVYNGQDTGRYRWDQLMKTEKTHFGTLFEINAQREFGFPGGTTTDYEIAGHQVDAKWSQSLGGWMLPPEVFGELALVGTASDFDARWSLGLIRVTAEVRRETVNRDKKSQLNELGRSRIRWLWRDADLRPNVLLQLPAPKVDFIFAGRSGTDRVSRLFTMAEGMLVHRNSVATVSRQLDHQKRVRYNGGARSVVAADGYLILSGLYHRALAVDLGLPAPRVDEYISVRVVPAEGDGGALIEGRRWRRAMPGEAPSTVAPYIGERGMERNR